MSFDVGDIRLAPLARKGRGPLYSTVGIVSFVGEEKVEVAPIPTTNLSLVGTLATESDKNHIYFGKKIVNRTRFGIFRNYLVRTVLVDEDSILSTWHLNREMIINLILTGDEGVHVLIDLFLQNGIISPLGDYPIWGDGELCLLQGYYTLMNEGWTIQDVLEDLKEEK